MTLRSVRVLSSKLREQEDAALDAVREQLGRLAARVELLGADPSLRVHDRPELSDLLSEFFEELRHTGVLLLRTSMAENLKAMGRDVSAIESTIGPRVDGLVEVVFERFDSAETLAFAEQQWRHSLLASFRVMVDQMEYQRLLGIRYEDDVMARWVSETPLRVIGRSGRGVIPSFDSVMHAAMVNWVYALVNGSRDAIAEAVDQQVDRVGVAV